jgi:hypothetical protein
MSRSIQMRSEERGNREHCADSKIADCGEAEVPVEVQHMVEVDQLQKNGFPLKRAPPHIFGHGIFANPEEDLSQAGIESCRLPS